MKIRPNSSLGDPLSDSDVKTLIPIPYDAQIPTSYTNLIKSLIRVPYESYM